MTEVNFYDQEFLPEAGLTYSIISARYHGSWIFVRHHKRTTWEIAGGHIEENETPYEAACRELREETGATDFVIECVSTYSVNINGTTRYGRLYFAEVNKIGSIPDISEIAESVIRDSLPDNLTYPDIQPFLFKRVLRFLEIADSGIRNSDQ